MAPARPRVAVLMGSASDYEVVEPAFKVLDRLGVAYEAQVLSAHRTPEAVARFARGAARRGFRVIIAAAGKAAHLPGVVAAYTTVPVIGLPIAGQALGGLDALLSMVQMPTGVPVAVVGLNAAENAALLAAGILALQDPALGEQLKRYRSTQQGSVRRQSTKLSKRLREQS